MEPNSIKNDTVVIVGGKLQGTEAAYLALKAGMEVTLVDIDPQIPARGLCHKFICADLLNPDEELMEALKKTSFILPAMENLSVLNALTKLSKHLSVPLAFDEKAYAISSSKILSDQLFRKLKLPAPAYYPDCLPPYIVKPSEGSGSSSVSFFDKKEDINQFFQGKQMEHWVAQEYLTGPSYSIEIIGKPGCYRTYEVTEIHMDEVFDCKRVTAPCHITPQQKHDFDQMAVTIAEEIKLTGIMDLEVIDHNGTFKLLEIDARIPSQTPTVVYHATGFNFVEELRDLFVYGEFRRERQHLKSNFVSYEHFLFQNGQIFSKGEHIMAEGGMLQLHTGIFGADEGIADGCPPHSRIQVGTFINEAETGEALEEKRQKMFSELKRYKF